MKLRMRNKLIAALLLCFLALCPNRPALALDSATWTMEIDGVQIWITIIARGHEISADNRNGSERWKYGNTSSDLYVIAVGEYDNLQLVKPP